MANEVVGYNGYVNYETWLISHTIQNVYWLYMVVYTLLRQDYNDSLDDRLETWMLQWRVLDWIAKQNHRTIDSAIINWPEIVEVMTEG